MISHNLQPPRNDEGASESEWLSFLNDVDVVVDNDCFDTNELLTSNSSQLELTESQDNCSSTLTKRSCRSKENLVTNPRKKRHCSSDRFSSCSTNVTTDQLNEETKSIASQNSFNERFDKALSMFAIAMQRSYISRNKILRHRGQEEDHNKALSSTHFYNIL